MIVREEKGDPLSSPCDTCDGGNLLVKPPEEKPIARRPSRYSYIYISTTAHYLVPLPGSLPGTVFRLITLAHAFIIWSVYLIHGLLHYY